MYGLDAALDELRDEGLAERQALYQARVDYLDAACARLGSSRASRRTIARARCAPCRCRTRIAYDTLHDRLKAEGYIIYAGLGDAAALRSASAPWAR